MTYLTIFYRRRRAQGEALDGKNLQHNTDETAIKRPEWIVYGVVGIMLGMVLARILIRVFGIDDSIASLIVYGITDPYVWVFNSLFGNRPHMLTSSVEPGSLASLMFFPLLGWALIGLIHEVRSNVFSQVSRRKLRR